MGCTTVGVFACFLAFLIMLFYNCDFCVIIVLDGQIEYS